MNTPVARRTSSIAVPIQSLLNSAKKFPPPKASVDAATNLAPQLIAVSGGLDLAILCETNTIRAGNLLDMEESIKSAENGVRIDEDLLTEVDFRAYAEPRPSDEVGLSDRIPSTATIQGLEFSPSGSSLLVWGESYLGVARIPRGSRQRHQSPDENKNSDRDSERLSLLDDGRHARRRHTVGARSGNARWQWSLVDMSGFAVDVRRQRIVQAAWHPASDGCLTVLTVAKDEASASESEASEAFVMLHVPGRDRPEQILSVPCGSLKSQPVAMAHGKGAGWHRFVIWIVRKDGTLAAFCPVVPHSAKIDSEELVELWRTTSDTLVAARWERSSDSGHLQESLEEEVSQLEQQLAWMRETFGDVFEDEDVTTGLSKTGAMVTLRGSTHADGRDPRALIAPKYPVLQDNILIGRGVIGNTLSDGGDRLDDGGTACSLAVLAGAGAGEEEGVAAAPPPTVLAIAYRTSCLDLVLVPSGLLPKWSDRVGVRVSSPASAAVLESLDMAERSEDNVARTKDGLSLTSGEGAWTLLAATPHRLTIITVTWAAIVEKALKLARERATREDLANRLDGDIRASLRERPDSAVAEVLFVPPSSVAGRIVGILPAASPYVGNLAIARLASGGVELANLSVVTLQATEVASAAKRARAQGTPGRGDILLPFEAAIAAAEKALGEREMGGVMRPKDSLPRDKLMSQLDEDGIHAFEKEAESAVEGGVIVLDKLHSKTKTRLEILREIYEHQSAVISGIAKQVRSLRLKREDVEDRIDHIFSLAEEQRDRSASVLAVFQAVRPEVSPAEHAFTLEMEEHSQWADRQQSKLEPAARQIEDLRVAEQEAEDYLMREAQAMAEGVTGVGRGWGLSEQEMQDIWTMLQADRDRIMGLSQRLQAARSRMEHLGAAVDRE